MRIKSIRIFISKIKRCLGGLDSLKVSIIKLGGFGSLEEPTKNWVRNSSLCFLAPCLNINYIMKLYRSAPNCMELGDLQQIGTLLQVKDHLSTSVFHMYKYWRTARPKYPSFFM